MKIIIIWLNQAAAVSDLARIVPRYPHAFCAPKKIGPKRQRVAADVVISQHCRSHHNQALMLGPALNCTNEVRALQERSNFGGLKCRAHYQPRESRFVRDREHLDDCAKRISGSLPQGVQALQEDVNPNPLASANVVRLSSIGSLGKDSTSKPMCSNALD